MAIVNEGESMCHEHRFAEAAGSDRGLATALDAAKALAKTAVELLVDDKLRKSAHDEWRASR
jgi:hypothetical protein